MVFFIGLFCKLANVSSNCLILASFSSIIYFSPSIWS